jgi:hypothetical protein
MAYAEIDTKPGAAHSTDPKSNVPYDPYRRFADQAGHSRLLLRPPDAPPASDDAEVSALGDIEAAIAQMTRTLRGVAAPWLAMPPDGESLHQAAGIPLPAVGAGFTPVLTIVVPNGRNGVINKIANTFVGGGFTDFSGNVVWQIQRNPNNAITAAERNYQQIQASLGSTTNPTSIAPIRIFENDVIVLAVSNIAVVVAGQEIGGLFGGWFYPRTWDDLFDQRTKELAW